MEVPLTYYYDPNPVKLGQKSDLIVGCGLKISDNRITARYLREQGFYVRLDEPPVRGTLKSKIVPRLITSVEGVRALHDALEVPKEYLPVLYWLAKKDHYLLVSEDPKDQERRDLKKLDSEIRAKLIMLAKAEAKDEYGYPIPGVPVYDRDTNNVQLIKLHTLIEKIDLGRRSDLKLGYSLTEMSQHLNLKYSKVLDKERRRDEEWAERDKLAATPKDSGVYPREKADDDIVFPDKPWLKYS
jgi:hypothetical protein